MEVTHARIGFRLLTETILLNLQIIYVRSWEVDNKEFQTPYGDNTFKHGRRCIRDSWFLRRFRLLTETILLNLMMQTKPRLMMQTKFQTPYGDNTFKPL